MKEIFDAAIELLPYAGVFAAGVAAGMGLATRNYPFHRNEGIRAAKRDYENAIGWIFEGARVPRNRYDEEGNRVQFFKYKFKKTDPETGEERDLTCAQFLGSLNSKLLGETRER